MLKFNIFENWHLKLLAVLIAFLLWFYVASQKSVQYDYTAALKYQNIPKNLVLLNDGNTVNSVKVVLQGPKNISNYSIKNLEIPVNLNNSVYGKNNIRIFTAGINLPEGFKLVEIIPDEIAVFLDKKIERKLTVVPELSGEPSENYEIENIIINPERIAVKGPETLLKTMNEIKTEIININGLAKSVMLETQINQQDNSIHIIDHSKIFVDIRIIEKRAEKKIQNIKIEINDENPGKYRIDPEYITAVIKGPKLMLENIDGENIRCRINPKNAVNGKIKPSLDLPDRIELLSVNPGVISVFEK
ncbi:MAG TPA: CdaR family protein [bacterium]|nr:CdaR family protein [bacterium]HPN29884.1 CdaR family protein [bacterium]